MLTTLAQTILFPFFFAVFENSLMRLAAQWASDDITAAGYRWSFWTVASGQVMWERVEPVLHLSVDLSEIVKCSWAVCFKVTFVHTILAIIFLLESTVHLTARCLKSNFIRPFKTLWLNYINACFGLRFPSRPLLKFPPLAGIFTNELGMRQGDSLLQPKIQSWA